MSDGSFDKTKVVCIYYRCELSYHRSMSFWSIILRANVDKGNFLTILETFARNVQTSPSQLFTKESESKNI